MGRGEQGRHVLGAENQMLDCLFAPPRRETQRRGLSKRGSGVGRPKRRGTRPAPPTEVTTRPGRRPGLLRQAPAPPGSLPPLALEGRRRRRNKVLLLLLPLLRVRRAAGSVDPGCAGCGPPGHSRPSTHTHHCWWLQETSQCARGRGARAAAGEPATAREHTSLLAPPLPARARQPPLWRRHGLGAGLGPCCRLRSGRQCWRAAPAWGAVDTADQQ